MRYKVKVVHTWLPVSQETQVCVFFYSFLVLYVAKVSECHEWTIKNRTLPPRNTLIQLLVLYTDPDSHNTQHYRPTDGRTDGHDDANHTVAI